LPAFPLVVLVVSASGVPIVAGRFVGSVSSACRCPSCRRSCGWRWRCRPRGLS